MKTKAFFSSIVFMVLTVLLIFSYPASAVEVYMLDPVHSSVVFRVRHMNISFLYGRFNNPTGTLKFNENNDADNFIEVRVKSADLDTNNPKRDEHLKNPDFFDAANYPEIIFKSRSFEKMDKDTYKISGDLTLHGVMRPVSFTATRNGAGNDPWGGFRTGFETTFSIKRSDFGMNKMIGAVGDEVLLTISIESIRQ